MRLLAPLLIMAACGGASKPAPEAPPAEEPPAIAASTCEDVGIRAGELSPGHPELVAQSRQNCLDQHWPAETITCVAGAATMELAVACLTPPEPALCAPLREIVAAGEDGTFTAIRGRLFDEVDPNRFEPTVEPPDNTGCELTTYGSGKHSCQMVHTPDRDTALQGFQQLVEAVQVCLPTWTATRVDNTVVFQRPDLDQSISVFASAYDWYDVDLIITGSAGERRAPVYDDDDDW